MTEVFRAAKLQRYVFFDCLTFFLIALAAFTGVLLTVQLLRLSDLVVNRGVAGADIAMMFIAVVPTFLELAIPMAAVVGVMLAVSRLSSDAELIVMRASGVSLYQLVPAIVLFGVALTVIGLGVSQELKPWGYRKVSELLFKIAQDRTTAGLEPGVFNKLGLITLYPERIDYRTGEMEKVVLDQRQPGGDRRIFFATRGVMASDPATRSLTLELFDGEMHEEPLAVATAGRADRDTQRNYSLTRFDSQTIDIGPEMLGASDDQLEPPIRAMKRGDLKASRAWYGEHAAETAGFGTAGIPLDGSFRTLIGLKTERELEKRMVRLDTELAIRWSIPFAALILGLVAFPLGIQPPRGQSSWGAGISVGLGLAVFLLYYGVLSIGLALAESRTVPSLVAVWMPNLVAAVMALWLIRGLASERVQSVAELAGRLTRFRVRRRSQ
jgi:lipopolysaccharide export system permease protein